MPRKAKTQPINTGTEPTPIKRRGGRPRKTATPNLSIMSVDMLQQTVSAICSTPEGEKTLRSLITQVDDQIAQHQRVLNFLKAAEQTLQGGTHSRLARAAGA